MAFWKPASNTAPNEGNRPRTNREVPLEERMPKPEKAKKEPKFSWWNEYTGGLRKGWGVLTGKFSLLQLIQENLHFTLFLVGICMVYIWNSHQAERLARRASELDHELKELRTEQLDLSAQLSVKRQLSQVAELVDSLGLKPLVQPPMKLEVQDE